MATSWASYAIAYISLYIFILLYSFVSIKCSVGFDAKESFYLKKSCILEEMVADWNKDSTLAKKQLL